MGGAKVRIGWVIGATVVGGRVKGGRVVGRLVVGALVAGARIIGAFVVGASVGSAVVGRTVVGAEDVVGATVVVAGLAVGAAVTGTRVAVVFGDEATAVTALLLVEALFGPASTTTVSSLGPSVRSRETPRKIRLPARSAMRTTKPSSDLLKSLTGVLLSPQSAGKRRTVLIAP